MDPRDRVLFTGFTERLCVAEVEDEHALSVDLAAVKDARSFDLDAEFAQHLVPADTHAAMFPTRTRRERIFLDAEPGPPQTDDVAFAVVQKLIGIGIYHRFVRHPAEDDVAVTVYRRVHRRPTRFRRTPRTYFPISPYIDRFDIHHNKTNDTRNVSSMQQCIT